MKEIELLSQIALIEPQAAYTCYVNGMQNRYNYVMRTIKDIDLLPLEEAIRHQLIPAITGGKTINDDERSLLSLPPRYGVLGIRNPIRLIIQK